MITGNEPAMPTTSKEFLHHSDYNTTLGSFGGLTIRQHFAAIAMQGLLSNPVYHNPNEKHKMITVSALAETAATYADALINELNKNQTT